MSSGLKRSRGNVWRLLLAKDLGDEREHGSDRTLAMVRGKSHPPCPQVPPSTHRWVRDLSPRKVAFESAWMSLFSMNLRQEEMVAWPP